MYKQAREVLSVDIELARGLTFVGNDLWICDQKLKQVLIMNTEGEALSRVGDKDLFTTPLHLSYCKGKVCVVDRGSKGIMLFDKSGKYLNKIELDENSPQEYPHGIAMSDDFIAVVDRGEHQVLLYDHQGKLKQQFGSLGDGEGHLCSPRSACFDKEGNVVVCDSSNHRLVRFSVDGEYLNTIGREGTQKGELLIPYDVKVDSQGNYIVLDAGNKRVQVLSPKGECLFVWEDLFLPFGIAVDQKDGFIVSDLQTLRFFSKVTPKSEA